MNVFATIAPTCLTAEQVAEITDAARITVDETAPEHLDPRHQQWSDWGAWVVEGWDLAPDAHEEACELAEEVARRRIDELLTEAKVGEICDKLEAEAETYPELTDSDDELLTSIQLEEAGDMIDKIVAEMEDRMWYRCTSGDTGLLAFTSVEQSGSIW